MSLLLVIAGVIVFILISGFYSGMETAAYQASVVRLRALEDSGNTNASVGIRLLGDLPKLITTTLIGSNLATYLCTHTLTSHLEHLGVNEAEFWATLTLTPLCFVFAETLPKRLAHLKATEYVMFGAGAAAVSQKVYLPLGIVLGLIGNVMQRVLHALGYKPAEHTGREKLLHYFEAVAAEDILSQEQHQMVQRILEAEDQTVRHVMLPLQKALLINEDSTCEAAASIMLDAGYNRAALTDKSGTPTGKLITLNAIMRNPASIDQPVYQLSLPLISIDANTRAGNALRRLQKENCRMAIATGKSGKPVGLITVSLLLGRVVGALRL